MENSNIEDTAKRSAQRFQDLKGWMGEQVYYSLHPRRVASSFHFGLCKFKYFKSEH